MRQRDTIDVLEFEFDDVNLDHLAAHKVTPEDVWSVLLNAPRFFLNLPDRGGSHVMVGPNPQGRFYYIALVETRTAGRWRPITGWPMNERRARQIYDHGEAK